MQGTTQDYGRTGRRRAWPWVLAAGLVGLTLLALGAAIVAVLATSAAPPGGMGGAFWEEEHVFGEGQDKIAVLPVSGVISSMPSAGGLLSGPSARPRP